MNETSSLFDLPPAPKAVMTEAKARVEMKRLALEIEGHDIRYHQEDAPVISDADYDALLSRGGGGQGPVLQADPLGVAAGCEQAGEDVLVRGSQRRARQGDGIAHRPTRSDELSEICRGRLGQPTGGAGRAAPCLPGDGEGRAAR